jgi:hypothetical protein
MPDQPYSLRIIKDEIGELQELVKDPPQDLPEGLKEAFALWAEDGGKDVLDACDELSEARSRDAALRALTAVQAFADRADLLLASVSGTVAGWFQTLKNSVRSVVSHVWNVVANLLTVTEWKLSGSLGTGVLGLANVQVEITFG